MAKRLIHDYYVIPSSATPKRIFIDGISARLVLFGSTTVKSVNVFFDGALAGINGSEVPTVYDWPVVRDENGRAIPYDTFLDIRNTVVTQNPIGFFIQIREVERP